MPVGTGDAPAGAPQGGPVGHVHAFNELATYAEVLSSRPLRGMLLASLQLTPGGL